MPDFAYNYLGKVVELDSMNKVFQQTVMFIRDGHHPQYLIDNTFRVLDAFGKEGFLPNDVDLLC